MWISRKEYKFLKENAEKNIDAECEILRARDSTNEMIRKVMKDLSNVFEERDRLRLEVIDLQQKLMLARNNCENFEEYLRKTN